MEEARGVERGSYIWGRSVHNTRIERLWYDVTHGFGQKWKSFFMDLEDAQEWAAALNSHLLHIRGERSRSPRDMFMFSMLQDGPRGLEYSPNPIDEPVDDVSTYGIDWDVADDPALMTHLLDHNPQDWSERNPFAPGLDALSHVPCEPPDAPFSPEEITIIDAELAAQVDVTSRSMHVRRLVWVKAMEVCNRFFT
ncbi:hypothetical protein FB451DRAFT_1337818 [Mycena latifolia]|nr:hypothetical protein FB451DRAFT_1341518 [Mycena latifolia]KAJ7485937.1 hypothetical protein FB451DRAFT_1337818 [Mycena latifolia]